MKTLQMVPILLTVALSDGVSSLHAEMIKLVTPDALPEAQALFDALQKISGHYTLTGQHNYPASGDRNSKYAAKYTGHMPAVWTSDFGFAGEGDKDSAHVRADTVAEAIRQHRMGSVISLCWHAVPPTADEPVTFRPKPGADPAKLESVQGRLLDEQFKDVLTPGTALHAKWAAQVDEIAKFLKQLEDAHVPVLWRPYHEMNGEWFWWGGRYKGQYTTVALYRQIFDRLVNHHHLRNLIWVWNVDRVHRPAMDHDKYFPGIEYADMLTLDVYGKDFAQSYYDSLVKLSHGKPLALGEVGNPPTPEILKKQPLWTYYATWAGMVRNTTQREYDTLFADPRVLNLDDDTYATVMSDYRTTCGLPPIQFVREPADFSGTWVLDESKSVFGSPGPAAVPVKLEVEQKDGTLTVKSTHVREFTDDEIVEEQFALDGSERKGIVRNATRTSTATVREEGAAIVIDSVTHLPDGGPVGRDLRATETWTLSPRRNELTILRVSDPLRGPGRLEQKLCYDLR